MSGERKPSSDMILESLPPPPVVVKPMTERRSTYFMRAAIWVTIGVLAIAVVIEALHNRTQDVMIEGLHISERQQDSAFIAYVVKTEDELGFVRGRQDINQDRLLALEQGVCNERAIQALVAAKKLSPESIEYLRKQLGQ